MTRRAVLAAIVAAAGIHFLNPRPAAAQGQPLRLFVSNGMKSTLEALQPQCERASGRPLAIEFNSTAALKKRIEMGEPFDVAIITTEAIDELVQQNLLLGASRKDLGRSELAIGIRAGAPRPDIRTASALKEALRAAPSVTYPQDGASRGYIETMFERFGITSEMKPKIVLASGSAAATESVAVGKAAMVLTLVSEILPIHGVVAVGPFPPEYRFAVRFQAATSSKSANADASTALIAFLAGPNGAPVLKAKGIERP